MKILISILGSVLFATSAMAADLSSIVGTWKTDDDDGRVEIYDCGDGTPCGRLTNVTDPSFIDSYNPDPELKNRHLQGVVILEGFKKRSKSTFKGGKIYNPGNGKFYRSSLLLTDEDQLKVKGCVFIVCQSQYWDRVE